MARNRILYFDLLLLVFMLFVLFDLYLFHLLLLFLLLLPVISLLAVLPVCFCLRYEMDLKEELMPKGNCIILLTAENACPLPCAGVRISLQRRNALGRVKDTHAEEPVGSAQFILGPRRRFTFQALLKMERCGRIDISVRRVRVCDMLGIFCIPVSRRNESCGACSVYVLPEPLTRTIQTEETAALGLDSGAYSTEKPGGDPAEIFQLRDYREGDSRHSIHWKLSSRMDRLIVREFGLPLSPSLHFLLELRADAQPEQTERLLGTALAFSEYLMAREIVHGISWLREDSLLHTATITDADALAAALHELLALPALESWRALECFAMRETPQPELHLVYLIAGGDWASPKGAEAEGLLANLLDMGVCRKITLMPDQCGRETAVKLRSLGCEVQLMDERRMLDMDAEEGP